MVGAKPGVLARCTELIVVISVHGVPPLLVIREGILLSPSPSVSPIVPKA